MTAEDVLEIMEISKGEFLTARQIQQKLFFNHDKQINIQNVYNNLKTLIKGGHIKKHGNKYYVQRSKNKMFPLSTLRCMKKQELINLVREIQLKNQRLKNKLEDFSMIKHPSKNRNGGFYFVVKPHIVRRIKMKKSHLYKININKLN